MPQFSQLKSATCLAPGTRFLTHRCITTENSITDFLLPHPQTGVSLPSWAHDLSRLWTLGRSFMDIIRSYHRGPHHVNSPIRTERGTHGQATQDRRVVGQGRPRGRGAIRAAGTAVHGTGQ